MSLSLVIMSVFLECGEWEPVVEAVITEVGAHVGHALRLLDEQHPGTDRCVFGDGQPLDVWGDGSCSVRADLVCHSSSLALASVRILRRFVDGCPCDR